MTFGFSNKHQLIDCVVELWRMIISSNRGKYETNLCGLCWDRVYVIWYFSINLIGVPCSQVLMNLTNDNPVGCEQIAGCGGLETMSSLIAAHFPSFSSSSSSPSSEIKEKSSSIDLDHQNDRHLSDQELDFLVAILGLLVNLVEKDGHNRLLLLICLSTCPPAFVCCSWFLEMLVLLTINCHTDSTMHLFLPPFPILVQFICFGH